MDFTKTVEIFRVVMEVVDYAFVTYLVGFSLFLFLSVAAGSSIMFRRYQEREMKNILEEEYYVPVTIIVPAYNESVTVCSTVRSLLSLEYPLYEIIVVDDGSLDGTSDKLIEEFDMTYIQRPIRRQIRCKVEESIYETKATKMPLTLVRKLNGGKADALNMGINMAQYPYFLCIDADSVLQYDSLTSIVRPVLEYSDIIAVGGSVRPSNGVTIEHGRVTRYRMPSNILACMQTLEYDRSFYASRFLFDLFNGNLIISGAFGLFKKDMVINAGGYDPTTMGEDMELVVKLHIYSLKNDLPYRIKYASDAVCWSQVPETLHDLRGQRRRWHIGLFQTLTRHRQMFASRQFGLIGIVSYLYYLIYELMSPIIEVVGLLTVAITYALDLLNPQFMVNLFILYAAYGSLLTMTSFFTRIYTTDIKLELIDVFKALGLCLFETVFLRFAMMWVRLTAFWGYKQRKLDWKKIQRQKIDLI